jgi:formylglycine-generating enzyme required for sulfatase activity
MRSALLLLLTVPLFAQTSKPSTAPAKPAAASAKAGGAPAAAAKPVPAGVKYRKDPKDGMTYVFVPAGTFMMGCPAEDLDCYSWEGDAHSVTIKNGFWMSQTEVTQSAYRAVTNVNPSSNHSPGMPVDQVTWFAARSFCASTGKRLPTEAEWEYAARAGSTQPMYGPANLVAWTLANSIGNAHPVGLKQPNKFGLYDMLGNLWEWTEDTYGPMPEFKIARGGAFLSPARDARASNRLWLTPDTAHRDIGFRCVADQ